MSEEDADTFSQWGIQTLGELAELPEVDLIARLGQEGKRFVAACQRRANTLILSYRGALCLEEFVEFDAPVETLESLLFALNSMLGYLVKRASSRPLAVASLSLVCDLENAPSHTRSVRPALPTEDRHILLKLLQLDLAAHGPSAGVVSVRLSAASGAIT